jgi:hypothetical protein
VVNQLYLVNMPPTTLTPSHALALASETLAILLGAAPGRVQDDGLLSIGTWTFALTWESSSRVAAVARALRRLGETGDEAIPLLVVPYMGDSGGALCADAGVSWLDLSGNAYIVGSGLRIVIEGKPNRFGRRGRPRSAFAPKSARIARWLLMHPGQAFTQAELAEVTAMDRGFTSRIVHRLLADELVERRLDGSLFTPRPDLLLEAWAQDYAFVKHRIHKGVVAARSGNELAERLARGLVQAGVEHAFTGLAAAWQITRFAGFRLSTVYLPDGLEPDLERALGFRPMERGANTWLVVPNDRGVLHGTVLVDGLSCAHPVQVWLDLSAHPERSKEAADRLRDEQMRWNDDQADHA